ncbi:nuclear transcription factor Y subunit gamma-like isoform X2 [Acanthaster planci]|uniref:Nuclear transcription factor Y subunit gamma n=1 Tax=Acanthaster planci TaxID=133434 RepID=A0A8B7Y8V9_ACAPL|nr:nuclear transcription factor Y subunit gamma-like isoform X2 [Acanthaster planci]
MEEATTSEEPSSALQAHENFWITQTENINNMKHSDFKTQELPLARIKKIMKLDEEVKMISAEAPVLFSKAAEMFISELSLRAWLHTEDNKRRTLQRNDIAMAITKYDQFDFLIDIVPRDELKTTKRTDGQVQQAAMMPEQVQYYFQLAQSQSTPTSTATVTPSPAAVIPQNLGTLIATTQPQQLQTVQVSGNDSQVSTTQLISAQATPIQLQQTGQATGNIQHIITNTGEIQQVQLPVGQQIQYVRQTQGQQQQGIQQTGQDFVTQISNSQPPIYQIQTQAGTQQVFLQQPATTTSATAQ